MIPVGRKARVASNHASHQLPNATHRRNDAPAEGFSISANPRPLLQWPPLLLLQSSTSTDPLLLLLLRNVTATSTPTNPLLLLALDNFTATSTRPHLF